MRVLCIRKIFMVVILLSCIALMPMPEVEAASDPVVVELHYQNGVKYYKRGLYEKAIGEFERTLLLDPAHKEAKDFLDKVQKMDERQRRVEAKKSQNAQLEALYQQGKKLYSEHDFEGALEVFNKILKLKPIDDFASFYRERCEIFIARSLAREKSVEQKRLLKEKKLKQKENRIKQKQLALESKRELAQERIRIKRQRQEDLKNKKLAAQQGTEEIVVAKEVMEVDTACGQEVAESLEVIEVPVKALTAKEIVIARKKKIREEKIAAAKARREEKFTIARQRREAKLARQEKIRQDKEQARQEKILAAQKKKDARLKEKEVKRAIAQQGKTKNKKPVSSSAQIGEKTGAGLSGEMQGGFSGVIEKNAKNVALEKPVKQLYLEGAEHLGRKEYAQAIASFSAVIEQEKSGSEIYTNASMRLRERAKQRLQESAIQKEKE